MRRAGAGGPAQRYGAERLLEMAAGGRAAQQAALGSSEALKALLERVLSGRLQARDCGLPTRAVCFTWGWALERCGALQQVRGRQRVRRRRPARAARPCGRGGQIAGRLAGGVARERVRAGCDQRLQRLAAARRPESEPGQGLDMAGRPPARAPR